jgi:hypothetical protein
MDPSEGTAEEFLSSRGFRPERFSTVEHKTGKTQDYRVFGCADLRFHCEVKGIEKDTWPDKQLANAPVGTVVAGATPDPTFNRLTADIHDTVKQFNAVNPGRSHPNVLIFCPLRSQVGPATHE